MMCSQKDHDVKDLPERRDIKLFLAAAKATSQVAAAAEEGVTKNQMHRACAAVSDFLGKKAFYSNGRTHGLTTEGKTAVRCLTKILDQWNQLEDEIRRQPNEVRVAATPSFIAAVTQAASKLRSPYKATIKDGFSPVLRGELLLGDIDVYVGWALSEEEDAKIEVNKLDLAVSPLRLIVPKERAGIADLREKLHGLTFCNIDDTLFPAFADATTAWLGRHGLANGPRHPRPTGAAVLATVSLGGHFGILPHMFNTGASNSVHFDLEVVTPGFEAALGAFFRFDESSKVVELFVNELASVFGVAPTTVGSDPPGAFNA